MIVNKLTFLGRTKENFLNGKRKLRFEANIGPVTNLQA